MWAIVPNWLKKLMAILVVAIIIAVVFFLIGSWTTSVRKDTELQKDNNNAISGANKGEFDYLNCHTGWMYDFGTQKCIRVK